MDGEWLCLATLAYWATSGSATNFLFVSIQIHDEEPCHSVAYFPLHLQPSWIVCICSLGELLFWRMVGFVWLIGDVSV